jgi:transcriptional regulator with XRE-family HTH domain
MSNLSKLQKLTPPAEAALDIAKREKALRKKRGFTQTQLSSRSGVTLGTLRRFEQTGQISFESLIRLCRALDCESQLDNLFAKPAYRSIQEVIDDQQRSR